MARILIADDEAQLRRVLRMMLRAEGHEVAEAADGAEAAEACRRAPFDVVLCDLHMPKREGLDVIPELRQRCPSLGLVAVSGGGEALLQAARRRGADAVLRKPFRLEDLHAAVSEALAARPPHAAAG